MTIAIVDFMSPLSKRLRQEREPTDVPMSTARSFRFLIIGLFALSCAALSGCGSLTGKGPDAAPISVSGQAQTSNTASPHEKGSTASEHFERWKSCVRLIRPDGGYSAAEIRAMFEPPQNIQQLLQNLKLAWQQDMLLQPSFYDPTILQKFFAGSAVTSTQPWNPLSQDVGFVVIELDSNVVQGMTIRVESRCWRTDYESAPGRVESTANILGALTISGGTFAGMTLRAVRDVFGPETENDLDSGGVENGVVYAPAAKGSVIYTDRAKEKAEGGLALGTTFVFPRKPWQRDLKLVDDDIVQNIRMHAKRHRLLEK
jgi:hypothetical protein